MSLPMPIRTASDIIDARKKRLTPFPETNTLRPMGKTNLERLKALREKRALAGLRRFEVYLRPSEWPLVKRYIERLARKRQQ